MNKTSIYYFSLAAIAIGSLASCQDYEPFDEETVREAATIKEFTKNFEARYGKIDPNHTWGFSEMQPFGTSVAKTRSTDGAGLVRKDTENWTQVDNHGFKPDQLAAAVQIPGYPNFDGYYYTSDDQRTDLKQFDSRPSEIVYRAVGDVTDYEIQYVSNWFRHNQNPTSNVQLHLSDFFIQNISADNDRVGGGDGELITNILSDNQTCDFEMDHLVFALFSSTPYNSSTEVDDTWTHNNDFNRNATPTMYTQGTNADDIINDGWEQTLTNKTVYTNAKLHKRIIEYVTSSGTEDFACKLSAGQGNLYRHDWRLVHLEWSEVGLDGEIHNREGYYLGFDYSVQKEVNGKIETYPRDGYFSNWIVKITPAYASEEPKVDRHRVMCEDLGNTWDFDFNDVVFDVYYENVSGGTDAVITIQAAGGTLPIYVGHDPSVDAQFSANFYLGQTSNSIPINVGAGTSAEIAIYRLRMPIIGSAKAKYTADDIPIYVLQPGQNTADTQIQLRPATGGYGESIAPQKICIPDVTTKWLKESQQIEWGYGYFDEWVQDEDGTYGFYTYESWDTSHNQPKPNTNAWNKVHRETSLDPKNPSEIGHLY